MADNSAEQCIMIIRELEGMLAGARGAFMDQQSCVVNGEAFQNKLRLLSSSLPVAVKTATDYISSINSIRQQAEQDCEVQMRNAQQQSAQLVSDAEMRANTALSQAEQRVGEMIARSQNEAQEIIGSARAEAARIIENAQQTAQQLLQKEDILRRARVEASELRESAQLDAAQMRQQGFDYLDRMTGELDRHLSELLVNVRRERAGLSNMR